MRMPSPQHVMDSDQRTLELPFSTNGDELSAEVPASGVPAPPGYYYLFINRKSDKGYVPSVARIVHVGSYSNDEEAIEPMPDAGFDGNGATPVEDNTLLNNPPNPNDPATVPGESDGLLDTPGDDTVGPTVSGRQLPGLPAPAPKHAPDSSGSSPEGVLPGRLTGRQGRRGGPRRARGVGGRG